MVSDRKYNTMKYNPLSQKDLDDKYKNYKGVLVSIRS